MRRGVHRASPLMSNFQCLKQTLEGRRSFLLGVAAPFVLDTTSVDRASAVGLEELEKLEELGN